MSIFNEVYTVFVFWLFFVSFCLTNTKVKDNVKFVRGVAMNCGLGKISQLAFYDVVKMLMWLYAQLKQMHMWFHGQLAQK